MLSSSTRYHIFNLVVIEPEMSEKFEVSEGWGVSDVRVRYSKHFDFRVICHTCHKLLLEL